MLLHNCSSEWKWVNQLNLVDWFTSTWSPIKAVWQCRNTLLFLKSTAAEETGFDGNVQGNADFSSGVGEVSEGTGLCFCFWIRRLKGRGTRAGDHTQQREGERRGIRSGLLYSRFQQQAGKRHCGLKYYSCCFMNGVSAENRRKKSMWCKSEATVGVIIMDGWDRMNMSLKTSTVCWWGFVLVRRGYLQHIAEGLLVDLTSWLNYF